MPNNLEVKFTIAGIACHSQSVTILSRLLSEHHFSSRRMVWHLHAVEMPSTDSCQNILSAAREWSGTYIL
jgi:hypothetical protein